MIAVPILGVLILLGLILLACTLLKSDWRKISEEDRLKSDWGKISDNDRLLPTTDNNCDANEKCLTSVAIRTFGANSNCQKLGYQPKPFPGYLRSQLRHYHSDTTLVVAEQKTKDERPNTVLFSPKICDVV